MGVLIAALIVIVSILSHETGHFLAAKILNYEISEFSIGYGPKLIQKARNGIMYSLRLLPFGGYVKLEDEKNTKKRCMTEPSFFKFVVLIMGPLFNVIITVLCIAIIGVVYGHSFFESLGASIQVIGVYISTLFEYLSSLFCIDNYGSVVSFASTTNEVVSAATTYKDTMVNVLLLTANLNIGIAVINLLPLPVFDGGQIVINAVELIIKKQLPNVAKNVMNFVTIVFLILFGGFLLIRDIINLV